MEYLVGKLTLVDLNELDSLQSEPSEFHGDKLIVRTGLDKRKEEISRRGLNFREFYSKRENEKVEEELQKVLEACHPEWPEARREQREAIIKSILDPDTPQE